MNTDTNVKIISLDPIPELAAYRLGFEAGGSPYCVQVTDEALLGTLMGLLKGELDLVVHLKGSWLTTELVRAARGATQEQVGLALKRVLEQGQRAQGHIV